MELCELKEKTAPERGEDRFNRLLTGAQLADYIGMSKKFISKHTEAGRLPGVVRCGRLLRYDRQIIDRRLAAGNLLLEKEEKV